MLTRRAKAYSTSGSVV